MTEFFVWFDAHSWGWLLKVLLYWFAASVVVGLMLGRLIHDSEEQR